MFAKKRIKFSKFVERTAKFLHLNYQKLQVSADFSPVFNIFPLPTHISKFCLDLKSKIPLKLSKSEIFPKICKFFIVFLKFNISQASGEGGSAPLSPTRPLQALHWWTSLRHPEKIPAGANG